MIYAFTQWMVGFTIIAGFLFWLVFLFGFQGFQKTLSSRLACFLMLFSLAGIQYFHWQFLNGVDSLFGHPLYVAFLFIAPPSFYIFVREMLQPNATWHSFLVLHYSPVVLSAFISGELAVFVAFSFGFLYSIWLSIVGWRLKSQRLHFKAEIYVLIGFAVTALSILIIGLCVPLLGEQIFVIAYANLTGIIVFILIFLFLRYPNFGEKTKEVAEAAYASSTLKNMDVKAIKNELDRLFQEQKIYCNENLSLSVLAEQLGVSAHQASELINTECGMGFSRLLREYRVQEARQILQAEPRASVLSVGLSVGFTSQSNFYSAFREITGLTPGQYRKNIPK